MNSSEQVLLEYFEWALRGLGLEQVRSLLSPATAKRAWDLTKPAVEDRLTGVSDAPLNDPEEKFCWEPPEDPKEDLRSYQQMLAAMLAALAGHERGIQALAALLVTAPINRKLSISYFLGNLTGGEIGTLEKEIPAKEKVIEWARKARYVLTKDHLPRIAEFAQSQLKL